MTWGIKKTANSVRLSLDGVDRLALNDDGSMELLTPAANPTGNDVPTVSQAQATDLGVGQTWQNLTGSRAIGTTYTNNTGRPIMVSVTIAQGASGAGNLLVDGVIVASVYFAASTDRGTVTAVVPAGSTYSYNITAGAQTLNNWAELR